MSTDYNTTKTISYRTYKNINHEQLGNELKEALENLPATRDMGEKILAYNRVLTEKVKQFAPEKTKVIKVRPTAPWFDGEYQAIRKERRKAEKKFRKSRNDEDKKELIKLRDEACRVAKDKKLSCITKKLDEGSAKTLYQVVNDLSDNNKVKVLPTAKSDEELANKFLHYFQQKIEKIRAKFPPKVHKSTRKTKRGVTLLSNFRPTSEEELREIITKHGIKTSPEDPMPAEMLKKQLDTLLPFWVEIVNLSLEVGKMDELKCGLILPLIKELNSMTDTEELKNYRPVTNLVFIGKLIERVVDIRLQEQLDNNQLNINKEYGYKKHHSTEMLLVWVTDNLLIACDNNTASVVLLLDLSAAFDTVDHEKLLSILEEEIGVTGVALQWFREFLTNRTQKVKIGGTLSEVIQLLFGVIQGSILGPRLFNIYIRSIYKHVGPTKFEIVGFADDHQLIKQFILALKFTALGDDIRNCLNVIAEWMTEFFLCLNQTKTKIMVVAPPAVKEKIIISGVILEDSCIRFVESAKNLGVILDSTLSFDVQIQKLVKSCHYDSTVMESQRIPNTATSTAPGVLIDFHTLGLL